MARWTFSKTKAGYAHMWASCVVTREDDAERFAKTILENKDRYKKIETAIGVPWYFVGIIHMRESSCNFDGVLHNGERIIGKGRKTRLVPANRGPFETWEEAAIDALTMKGLQTIDWSAETVSRIGYEGERYNGFGYAKRGINSPYLWAGSNHQQPGKYVRDGVWDSHYVDTQMGIMPVLMVIAEHDAAVAGDLLSDAPPVPVSRPTPVKPAVKSTTNWAGGGILASVFAWIMARFDQLGDLLTNPTFLVFVFVAALAAYIIWERNGKPDIAGIFKSQEN